MLATDPTLVTRELNELKRKIAVVQEEFTSSVTVGAIDLPVTVMMAVMDAELAIERGIDEYRNYLMRIGGKEDE